MLSLPNLSSIHAVVFDLDGTLIDSEAHYCHAYIHAMTTLGGSLEVEDYYQRFAGRTDDAIDESLQAELPGPVELATIRRTWRCEFERLRETTGLPVMPGALQLLDFLQGRGLPLAIASAAGLGDITASLDLAGIRDRFQALCSATEVFNPKPAPDVYLLAAERLAVDPGRCLAFEDTNAGTRAAIRAGMYTVMVPHRCQPDAFARRHASGIAASLTEIVDDLR